MKKIIMITLFLAMTLSLVACQATPDKGFVKGKNLDKMIEEAIKTPAQGSSNSASQSFASSGKTIADIIGAQKNYTKELVDPKGKVKIHVNADVQIPDVQGVTVQRVERTDFTQQQVDVLVKQLMHGDLFSGDDYKPSKSEIQQQIVAIQAEMAKNGESPTASYDPFAGQKGQAAKDKEKRNEKLQELQEQLKTAPDATTKTPITGKLEPMTKDEGTGTKLYALAQSDKGYESLKIGNDAKASLDYVDYISGKNGFVLSMAMQELQQKFEGQGITPQEIAQIPDVKITKDQAKQKVEDLIKALGVENMVCYSADKAYGGSTEKTADQTDYINSPNCVWFLRYVRSVNNVPVTYTTYDCLKNEKDAQTAPWGYEEVTFAVDDSGIVGFRWNSPYKITGTVTENSNLASFADIMHVFDTMSLVVNTWDSYSYGSPDLTGIEITVDHIKFGLTRITEQNKRDSGLLVPAWDFMGTTTQLITQDGQTKRFDNGPIPILTVNAIDGSIINRDLGY